MEQRRVNVRAIIWQDGKLLAVKHKDSDGSETDYWAVPGGGLDPQELLTAGLQREIQEETGKNATIGKLLFIQQFSGGRRTKEELEFFFHVTNPMDFASIDLTATSHGVDEIAHIEFIDPSSERILPSFLQSISIGDYITEDKPVYIYDEL